MSQVGRPRAPVQLARRRTFLRTLQATLDLETARVAAGMTEASAWRIVRALGVEGVAAMIPDVEARAA